MTKEYKELEENVRAIVNNYDPEGLVSGGAPLDEYDSYTHRIISLGGNHQLDLASLKSVFPQASTPIDFEKFLSELNPLFN